MEIARRLTDGRLELFDIQPEMLEQAGLSDVGFTVGQAGDGLPFPDNTIDVAFLSAVIGEVPDKRACLRSLGQVLKPGGRLVFVEMFPDPDRLSVRELRDLAEPRTSNSSKRAETVGKPSPAFAGSTARSLQVCNSVSPRAINGPTVSPTRSDASTSSAPPDIRLRKSMPAAMMASLK